MLFGHDVVAEAGCIGIFAILINTLYLKNVRSNELMFHTDLCVDNVGIPSHDGLSL
jgi:hypothetical protein